MIAGNPIPAPRRRKKGAERTHLPAVLTKEGVGAILRAADAAEVGKGVRRAHMLAAFTAQRIGEIVGATWDEMDLQSAVWSIPRDRMKRKDAERGPHLVPIPPRLLALLEEWHRVGRRRPHLRISRPARRCPYYSRGCREVLSTWTEAYRQTFAAFVALSAFNMGKRRGRGCRRGGGSARPRDWREGEGGLRPRQEAAAPRGFDGVARGCADRCPRRSQGSAVAERQGRELAVTDGIDQCCA